MLASTQRANVGYLNIPSNHHPGFWSLRSQEELPHNGNKGKMSVVTIGKTIFTSSLLVFSNKGMNSIRCSEANVSSLKV